MPNSPTRLPRFLVLDKKRGVTPLETVQAWKTSNEALIRATDTSPADFPVAYAGRLDPMAEGKLLVLLGEECKRMDHYTGLDKEYIVEVLLDFSTDTGDVLGLPNVAGCTEPNQEQILEAIKKETGTYPRKYPIFSSKTVKGKPLFLYALEGVTDSIKIPEHLETFYDIRLLGIERVSTEALKERIIESLREVPRSDEPSKKLGADFRQDEIRTRWSELFELIEDRECGVLKLRVTCGSGAYMRTLAQRIGESLGTSGLALSINRTRIGKVFSMGACTFWTKQYK